jgi:hypothetical protein
MALRGTTGNAPTAAATSNAITYAGAGNIQVGDLIVLITHLVNASSGGTFTDPSGFTAGGSLSPALPDVFNSVTGADYIHIAVKIAAGGDTGTPTYTTNSSLAAGHWQQQIRVYSGRVNSSIAAAFNNQVATAVSASTSTPFTYNLTGLTALAGDDVIAVVEGGFPSGNSGGSTWGTTITGYANALNNYDSTYNFAGFLSSLDNTNVSAGATGTLGGAITATGGNTQVAALGFVMSLPQAATPTPPFTPFTQTQFFVSDLIIQQ